jgi:MFS family permease
LSLFGSLSLTIGSHYNINYGTVATIFLCNALGFVAAAFFVSTLSQKLGRAKTLVISEAFLMVGYTIIVTTPPFGVVAFSYVPQSTKSLYDLPYFRYFILGIGMAINLAIGQVFCANLANNTVIVGLFQGAYGFGGTIAPIIATTLVSRGYLWSRFWIIELGLATLNLFFTAWAFWKYEIESDPALPPPANGRNDGNQSAAPPKRRWKSIKTLLTHKTTVFGALFIFGYQVSYLWLTAIFYFANARKLEPAFALLFQPDAK